MKRWKAWFGWSCNGGGLEVVELEATPYGKDKHKVLGRPPCLDCRTVAEAGELHESPIAALRALQDKQRRVVEDLRGDVQVAEGRLAAVQAKMREIEKEWDEQRKDTEGGTE